jgi:hypothetical protein
MKGKGPRDERETIINFNEAEPCASIWTAIRAYVPQAAEARL